MLQASPDENEGMAGIVRPRDWAGDWQQFESPETVHDRLLQAFRPELFEGVESRRNAQSRVARTGQRNIARLGLDIDTYNALERPGSRHIKTAQGCFNLQSDTLGEMAESAGVGLRWYRVACKDLLQNPLTMPAWETDALGLAVP